MKHYFTLLIIALSLCTQSCMFEDEYDDIIEIPDGATIISYTTTNNRAIDLSRSSLDNVLSNTYNNDMGKIVIAQTLVTIPEKAFYAMPTLQSITIPDTVSEIGDNAFAESSNLDTIYCYPAVPPKCGKNIFNGIGSNFKIYIYAAYINIYQVIDDWKAYIDAMLIDASLDALSIGTPPANEIWYISTNNKPVVPNEPNPNHLNVEGFGANIISNTCVNHRGVIKFDDDVTQLGAFAFRGCENLACISLPNNLKRILSNVFGGCTNLAAFSGRQFIIPEDRRSLITKQGELFYFAPAGVKTYTIPSCVTAIIQGSFAGAKELREVTIPYGVSTIGDTVFADCTSLKEVSVPNTLTSVGTHVFHGCSALETFKGDGASADGRCIVVNNAICAFAPVGITEYTTPQGVEAINECVFEECELTSITISEGVHTIGLQAFAYSKNLKTVNLPNSLIIIEERAFNTCDSMESITIPSNVATIGFGAFTSENLKTVYCKATTPPTVEEYIFGEKNKARSIYVPADSVEAYKAASGWSNYADEIVGHNF